MKQNVLKILLLSAVALTAMMSCVSPPIQERRIVEKVDIKILDEFDTSVKDGDFYGASGSFIEFIACCEDERKFDMIQRIEELYREKVAQTKDPLSVVEYTYSFINLAHGFVDEEKLNVYRDALTQSIDNYIEADLKNKSDLEKASLLLNLSNYAPGYPRIYSSLAQLFILRENLLLAQKYYELSLKATGEGTDPGWDDLRYELSDKIEALQSRFLSREQKIEIEDTIKSSVKIMVDRGIRTESGVSVPDQLLGTGVIIEGSGYVLTNYHIIESSVDPKYEGYSKVYVIPGKDESERFVAKILGYDKVFDLALLKIEKTLESRIKFGDSDVLKQGETVMAIGNPAGLTNTVTSGVISSTDRPFLQIGKIVQIDASLNPGNSGGALINGDGYLVGITFAGLANFENLNFAIPSNLVLSALFRLYSEGQVTRSWVGCSVEEREGRIAIHYIVPEGPADYARLLVGDVIKKVNGIPVSEVQDIQKAVANRDHPLIVDLTIERKNREEEKRLLLTERPLIPAVYVWNRDAQENIITPLFGIVMTKSDSSRKRDYLVTRVVNGSVASSAGISEGDMIKLRNLKYEEDYEVFLLSMELKSKRFGYLNKSLVLYSYSQVNSFI